MLTVFIEKLLREENPNDEAVCLFFFNSETEFEIGLTSTGQSFHIENCTNCMTSEKDNLDFLDDMGECEFYFGDKNYQFKNNKIVEVDESEMLVLC